MSFFEAIKAYDPCDLEEQGFKEDILTLLHQTDHPFSRENVEGHITGSAFVVDAELSKTCMIKHKKLGMWLQPGGHCDGNQEVDQTALRETQEEMGLTHLKLIPTIFDIDVHVIPEKEKNGTLEPEHKHYDIRYLIVANEHEKPVLQEDEIDDVAWLMFEEAVKLNPWRPFSRMVDKILSNKDYYKEMIL